ncbi:MAG: ribose-phosphate pyrophosphokinase [Bacteroidales bacterium]|nr:ribose-phosphate pyrophosphokinase [Bacteroidales bacterium]MDE6106513.1 ribose-phosphate pyrophosphokinase [Bacteroidales bacterium]MDE6112041.1 ribose-phosphate pyrophosphokinase [Bacteroidales bacterium]MDE6307950.1 ribose-phosphate pyrophosphokinase [Bacteroidales bacterium]MDE6440306.1 ribose-phosphate pyrophosphokinase [Bacteroidales bacterium]
METNTKVKIFTCRATRYLAEKIAQAYGSELGKSNVFTFADGEFQTCYEDNVRGADVFIVQSTFPPADNLFELLMMVDAAKRASARKIIAVIPYFGCARQDRKDKPRVPITSKLVANLLTASGVSRVITIDLHADQIQGFFEMPVDHLYASSIFVPFLKELNIEDLMFASPDTGGTRRANMYAKTFGTGFAICYKQRSKPNVVDRMELIGDVAGKNVILVDDILDTGNTLIKAADLILANGAKSVRGMISHPVLSGNAIDRIEQSNMEELIVSDTIPLSRPSKKIRQLSTATLLAEAIKRVENNESISSLYSDYK